MRRRDREIEDRALVENVLRRALVCRVALAGDEYPYIVPVNFGYEDGCLYFHSAPEGQKIDMLRQNNNVCFQADVDVELVKADHACNWSMRYRSVVGYGKAFFVEGEEEKRRGLGIIVAHYSDEEYQYPDGSWDELEIIRVEIEHMTGKQAGY